MVEMINTQTQAVSTQPVSQTGCEVQHFIQNFREAVHEGCLEEISTYFSDEMEDFRFPLYADWTDETILVDDHLATFSCTLKTGTRTDQRLSCVLDKSEGYWQIIFAEIRESHSH